MRMTGVEPVRPGGIRSSGFQARRVYRFRHIRRVPLSALGARMVRDLDANLRPLTIRRFTAAESAYLLNLIAFSSVCI
jgi:hypothetical protein